MTYVSRTDEAVVVCHGLWMPGSETWLLRRRLSRHGFKPYAFRYRTVGDGLARNAAKLRAFVAAVPEPVVHLVGYSLGGVVAVCMLRAGVESWRGRLVCLGSPLNGSASARALMRLPGGRRLLGRSVIELVEGGGLGVWRGSVEIGVVAGRLSFGLGRLIGAFDGPNDGTVAVEETRLAGVTQHIVRRVSHTSILFSRQVAADVAHFLRLGRFEEIRARDGP
jgi:pimeloyl-ACP methyl ester carboxylesterase